MKTIDIKWNDSVYTVFVDDDCYTLLSRHTWYIMYSGVNKRPYAFAELYSMKNGERIKRMFYMHQMITGSFAQTDHVNGNSLDNRFENLRPATHQTNGWNKGKSKRKGCSSQYKGVSYRPLRGKPRWLAFFKYVEEGKPKHTGKMLYIGYFDTEREAAIAYDEKVLQMRGKWAFTNILKNNNMQDYPARESDNAK